MRSHFVLAALLASACAKQADTANPMATATPRHEQSLGGTLAPDEDLRGYDIAVQGMGTLDALLQWDLGSVELTLGVFRGSDLLAVSTRTGDRSAVVNLAVEPGTYRVVLYHRAAVAVGFQLVVRSP